MNGLNFQVLYEKLMVGGDLQSFLFQYLFGLLFTLILVYVTAFVTRSFTFIRSHFWIFVEVVATSVFILAFYRIALLVRENTILLFLTILLTFPLSGFIENMVKNMDQGRSMVDIYANQKPLFHTDYRLIRRAAIFTMDFMWLLLVSLRAP